MKSPTWDCSVLSCDHRPALLHETITYLSPSPGKTIVDGTIGGLGHARAILEKILPDGRLIGIDRDEDAVRNAKSRLSEYRDNILLFHGNFKDIDGILASAQIRKVHGVLVDLGLSLHQIKNSGRGFSFQGDEPLDMRMDIRQPQTAAAILNAAPVDRLADIFRQYGEERRSRRIAAAIVKERKKTPITSTRQLVELVQTVKPRQRKKRGKIRGIHPATRVFMALRIAVNEELEDLDKFIKSAVSRLYPGGRLCMLAFHSLEDRIVKHTMRRLSIGCVCPPEFPVCRCDHQKRVRLLTKKAIRPAETETRENPMARSALLRAAEKL